MARTTTVFGAQDNAVIITDRQLAAIREARWQAFSARLSLWLSAEIGIAHAEILPYVDEGIETARQIGITVEADVALFVHHTLRHTGTTRLDGLPAPLTRILLSKSVPAAQRASAFREWAEATEADAVDE
ncbi:MAG TPA: hypothetical protein VND19_17260 [Acetobacteraceae bacterium]|nr:hypothetical protein [Acetobacteraceae bacterium]